MAYKAEQLKPSLDMEDGASHQPSLIVSSDFPESNTDLSLPTSQLEQTTPSERTISENDVTAQDFPVLSDADVTAQEASKQPVSGISNKIADNITPNYELKNLPAVSPEGTVVNVEQTKQAEQVEPTEQPEQVEQAQTEQPEQTGQSESPVTDYVASEESSAKDKISEISEQCIEETNRTNESKKISEVTTQVPEATANTSNTTAVTSNTTALAPSAIQLHPDGLTRTQEQSTQQVPSHVVGFVDDFAVSETPVEQSVDNPIVAEQQTDSKMDAELKAHCESTKGESKPETQDQAENIAKVESKDVAQNVAKMEADTATEKNSDWVDEDFEKVAEVEAKEEQLLSKASAYMSVNPELNEGLEQELEQAKTVGNSEPRVTQLSKHDKSLVEPSTKTSGKLTLSIAKPNIPSPAQVQSDIASDTASEANENRATESVEPRTTESVGPRAIESVEPVVGADTSSLVEPILERDKTSLLATSVEKEQTALVDEAEEADKTSSVESVVALKSALEVGSEATFEVAQPIESEFSASSAYTTPADHETATLSEPSATQQAKSLTLESLNGSKNLAEPDIKSNTESKTNVEVKSETKLESVAEDKLEQETKLDPVAENKLETESKNIEGSAVAKEETTSSNDHVSEKSDSVSKKAESKLASLPEQSSLPVLSSLSELAENTESVVLSNDGANLNQIEGSEPLLVAANGSKLERDSEIESQASTETKSQTSQERHFDAKPQTPLADQAESNDQTETKEQAESNVAAQSANDLATNASANSLAPAMLTTDTSAQTSSENTNNLTLVSETWTESPSDTVVDDLYEAKDEVKTSVIEQPSSKLLNSKSSSSTSSSPEQFTVDQAEFKALSSVSEQSDITKQAGGEQTDATKVSAVENTSFVENNSLSDKEGDNSSLQVLFNRENSSLEAAEADSSFQQRSPFAYTRRTRINPALKALLSQDGRGRLSNAYLSRKSRVPDPSELTNSVDTVDTKDLVEQPNVAAVKAVEPIKQTRSVEYQLATHAAHLGRPLVQRGSQFTSQPWHKEEPSVLESQLQSDTTKQPALAPLQETKSQVAMQKQVEPVQVGATSFQPDNALSQADNASVQSENVSFLLDNAPVQLENAAVPSDNAPSQQDSVSAQQANSSILQDSPSNQHDNALPLAKLSTEPQTASLNLDNVSSLADTASSLDNKQSRNETAQTVKQKQDVKPSAPAKEQLNAVTDVGRAEDETNLVRDVVLDNVESASDVENASLVNDPSLSVETIEQAAEQLSVAAEPVALKEASHHSKGLPANQVKTVQPVPEQTTQDKALSTKQGKNQNTPVSSEISDKPNADVQAKSEHKILEKSYQEPSINAKQPALDAVDTNQLKAQNLAPVKTAETSAQAKRELFLDNTEQFLESAFPQNTQAAQSAQGGQASQLTPASLVTQDSHTAPTSLEASATKPNLQEKLHGQQQDKDLSSVKPAANSKSSARSKKTSKGKNSIKSKSAVQRPKTAAQNPNSDANGITHSLVINGSTNTSSGVQAPVSSKPLPQDKDQAKVNAMQQHDDGKDRSELRVKQASTHHQTPSSLHDTFISQSVRLDQGIDSHHKQDKATEDTHAQSKAKSIVQPQAQFIQGNTVETPHKQSMKDEFTQSEVHTEPKKETHTETKKETKSEEPAQVKHFTQSLSQSTKNAQSVTQDKSKESPQEQNMRSGSAQNPVKIAKSSLSKGKKNNQKDAKKLSIANKDSLSVPTESSALVSSLAQAAQLAPAQVKKPQTVKDENVDNVSAQRTQKQNKAKAKVQVKSQPTDHPAVQAKDQTKKLEQKKTKKLEQKRNQSKALSYKSNASTYKDKVQPQPLEQADNVKAHSQGVQSSTDSADLSKLMHDTSAQTVGASADTQAVHTVMQHGEKPLSVMQHNVAPQSENTIQQTLEQLKQPESVKQNSITSDIIPLNKDKSGRNVEQHVLESKQSVVEPEQSTFKGKQASCKADSKTPVETRTKSDSKSHRETNNDASQSHHVIKTELPKIQDKTAQEPLGEVDALDEGAILGKVSALGAGAADSSQAEIEPKLHEATKDAAQDFMQSDTVELKTENTAQDAHESKRGDALIKASDNQGKIEGADNFGKLLDKDVESVNDIQAIDAAYKVQAVDNTVQAAEAVHVEQSVDVTASTSSQSKETENAESENMLEDDPLADLKRAAARAKSAKLKSGQAGTYESVHGETPDNSLRSENELSQNAQLAALKQAVANVKAEVAAETIKDKEHLDDPVAALKHVLSDPHGSSLEHHASSLSGKQVEVAVNLEKEDPVTALKSVLSDIKQDFDRSQELDRANDTQAQELNQPYDIAHSQSTTINNNHDLQASPSSFMALDENPQAAAKIKLHTTAAHNLNNTYGVYAKQARQAKHAAAVNEDLSSGLGSQSPLQGTQSSLHEAQTPVQASNAVPAVHTLSALDTHSVSQVAGNLGTLANKPFSGQNSYSHEYRTYDPSSPESVHSLEQGLEQALSQLSNTPVSVDTTENTNTNLDNSESKVDQVKLQATRMQVMTKLMQNSRQSGLTDSWKQEIAAKVMAQAPTVGNISNRSVPTTQAHSGSALPTEITSTSTGNLEESFDTSIAQMAAAIDDNERRSIGKKKISSEDESLEDTWSVSPSGLGGLDNGLSSRSNRRLQGSSRGNRPSVAYNGANNTQDGEDLVSSKFRSTMEQLKRQYHTPVEMARGFEMFQKQGSRYQLYHHATVRSAKQVNAMLRSSEQVDNKSAQNSRFTIDEQGNIVPVQ